MAADTERSVALRRIGPSRYVATNVRGDELEFGSGDGAGFTPVELLLAAVAGCSAIDVDILTSRRAEPVSFAVDARADKVRDESGNHLENLEVTFRVTFPPGDGGDAARTLLPEAVTKSHDRLCTVSRTVELGTAVTMSVE